MDHGQRSIRGQFFVQVRPQNAHLAARAAISLDTMGTRRRNHHVRRFLGAHPGDVGVQVFARGAASERIPV